MKKTQHNTQSKQKGFTLLFAVLIATLVVSIGATIISIGLRQTILSGTGRESQYAYYAASSALNCASYWDRNPTMPAGIDKDQVFVDPTANDSPQPYTHVLDSDSGIKCSNADIVKEKYGETGQTWTQDIDEGKTTFYLKIKDVSSSPIMIKEYCAEATVTKTTPDNTTGLSTTTIETKGYNTCDITNPRRVERGLIEQYTS